MDWLIVPGWYALLIAMAGDIVVSLALAAFYKGYSIPKISVTGFMLFMFVPLLIAILSFKNNDGVVGGISIACFVTALVFFVLFVMSDKEEFSKTFIANEGLWQRLNLLFMYLPLGIVAIKNIIR